MASRCPGQRASLSDAKILALPQYPTSPPYDERERVALKYYDEDCTIITEMEVIDKPFSRVCAGSTMLT